MAPLVQLTQTITQATTTYVTAFLLSGNQAWPTVKYVTQTLTYPSTTIVEVNITSTPTGSQSVSTSTHGGSTGSVKGAIAGSILGAFVVLILCYFCCCRRPSSYPPSSRSSGTRSSFSHSGGSHSLSTQNKNDALKESVGGPKQPYEIIEPPGADQPDKQNAIPGSSVSEETPQPSTGTAAPKSDNGPSKTKLSADPDQPKNSKSNPPSGPDNPQSGSSRTPRKAPLKYNPPLSKTFVPSPDPPPDPPPVPPTKKQRSPLPAPSSPQLIEIRNPRSRDISSIYRKTVGYTHSTKVSREGSSKPVVFKRKLERRTIWGGWPGSGGVTRPVARKSKGKKRGYKSKEESEDE